MERLIRYFVLEMGVQHAVASVELLRVLQKNVYGSNGGAARWIKLREFGAGTGP